jgi:ribose transport system ATP-binding protein
MRVKDLTGKLLTGVDFDLHAGEILGLTGLIDTGWDEVPYLLSGADPATDGQILIDVDGQEVAVDLRQQSVRKLMRYGVALLPANRLRDSAVAEATITENLTLPTLGRHFVRFRLRPSKEREHVARLIQRFAVRPDDPTRMLGMLSGGNQQKVTLSKWLEADPRIFLMHEPTQGVDVGSRQQIFEVMRASVDAGMSILLVSAEYQDLAHLCDRVLVFRDGRIVSELTGSSLNEEGIASECLRRQAS